MPLQFAMNRTCAPQLKLREFAGLAAAVGVTAVEIRNDIADREFKDGTSAKEVLAVLAEFGLAVASVNALQRFNEWTTERDAEARSLVAYAAELAAPGVVLCPVHNCDNGWSVADAEFNLREGLLNLRPILQDLGVKGYVEPLGMAGSTLKWQAMAVAAISDVEGWDVYELCYDTFQFYRSSDAEIFPERIGLAHMSGIVRPDLAPGALAEPDRVLIENIDRVGNIAQLRHLQASGYGGYLSMEPFNHTAQNSPTLLADLQQSFARVNRALQT
jgi:2-keto-myo-inositol isomerase